MHDADAGRMHVQIGKGFGKLRTIVDKMFEAATRKDVLTVNDLDIMFDDRTLTAANHPHCQLWRLALPRVRSYFHQWTRGDAESPTGVAQQHRKLLEALRARSEDRPASHRAAHARYQFQRIGSGPTWLAQDSCAPRAWWKISPLFRTRSGRRHRPAGTPGGPCQIGSLDRATMRSPSR